ncbi:zinc-dependent alcohol dehydrogenase family protein [Paenactinomyces guangxiensis]|uniref:Zinc-dependent alcohol dehydrogenase family protein n=2 Tax=Paenactinomyces guangxiensis TaxID=1490290 RepID=A0A7W1WSJ1_9BACL|nr:zinc-dependent alcohol dehydrogenase family protein [Paenactinomyces guangxiensis]MBA4495232.1 zinc-dependent alcohol dehydrogenase family protein [Paenactinomyces guangxiensis]MBH8592316.1 zinc-dependent alcohol dehydrogenase family protein [Paenactinomyces guangxiensis]
MEMERPKVQPGHVLIRVAATSVNPIDNKIRSGFVPALAPAFPAVLHGDVAGVIEEVGEGVTTFQSGDEVYACAGGVKGYGGALADYMLANAELVAHKPKSLSFTEAAALPLVCITAWEALIDRAQILPGQKVLIHGATGGVGHVAIQIAKEKGAQVYTTGSSKEKLKIARELGADVGIHYKECSVQQYVDKYTDGKGFDIVFDTVGGDNIDRSLEAVKVKGTVVTIAARSTNDLTPMHNKGLTLHAVFMILPLLTGEGLAHHGNVLRQISQLVDEGKLRPLLDANSYRFCEAALAHKRLESGQAIGKVTLINEHF